jgi:hypothetical protein
MCVMCVPTHNATHQFRDVERPVEMMCASATSSSGLRGSKFLDRLDLELQDSNVICYSADIHFARKCMSHSFVTASSISVRENRYLNLGRIAQWTYLGMRTCGWGGRAVQILPFG